MAQLKSTSINGNLAVTGDISSNGKINFTTGGHIYTIDSQHLEFQAGAEGSYKVQLGVFRYNERPYGWGIFPVTSGALALGGIQNHWAGAWLDSQVQVVSDERKKNILNYVQNDKRYFDFYEKLNPILYTWKNQKNDKIKVGLGAQTVEKALNSSGLTNNDFSGLCHEGDSYSLDYISYLMVGDAYNKNKIKELEERIVKLESR